MTIQVSVLIWTVINFCILMLVLNKLLFKPLLAFMDARNEKIARAKGAREEAMRLAAEAESRAEAERLEACRRAHETLEKAIADARHAAELEAAETEKEYSRLLAGLDADADAQKHAALSRRETDMDALVAAFTAKLSS